MPPASQSLYLEKLAAVPLATLSATIESLIEKGGKTIPHVGEIIGLARAGSTSRPSGGDKATPWEYAGMSFDAYSQLPASARRVFGERWRARCEAAHRVNGRPVQPSYFDPEPLDDVLSRLGLDFRGNPIDRDPLGLEGPRHVEEHDQTDTRPWDTIALEAGTIFRERIEITLAMHAQAREAQHAQGLPPTARPA